MTTSKYEPAPLLRLLITTLAFTWLLFIGFKMLFINLTYFHWASVVPLLIITIMDIYFLTVNLGKKPKEIDSSFYSITLCLLCFFATLLLSATYINIEATSNTFFRIASIALNGLAYPVIALALLTLKDNHTVLPEAHEIVKTGIYKLTRHPLYASYSLWILSSILMFMDITVTISGVCLISAFILRSKQEEKVLTKAFEEEYKEYKEEVDFIPGVKWL